MSTSSNINNNHHNDVDDDGFRQNEETGNKNTDHNIDVRSPVVRLIDCNVTKETQVVAISTPLKAQNTDEASCKTPIFYLPIYKVQLKLDQNKSVEFHCDLADMICLLDKLKHYENLWRRFGPIVNVDNSSK